MKKWWARISCLLLAMLLVVTALPVFAAEEEEAEEDITRDYVILLDCSMSTSENDTENLCLQACLNFLDKLPIYDTRVSIIAFGYEDGTYYDSYSSFNVQSEKDKGLIHVIVPLSELTSSDDKEDYKERVTQALEENRTNARTWTPYAHALAAAVDMLEKNTDPDATRNACVILISDGVLDDREINNDEDNKYKISNESERLLTEASQKAGTHDWPIYSIQLNYSNTDVYESNLARERLAAICANGGINELGNVECKADTEVFIALQNIFADFQNLPDPEPVELTLPDSSYFTVEALTSEYSIDIFGEGISSVSLYRVDENGNRLSTYRNGINKDIYEDELIVSAGSGYYSIKMICPDEGHWEVYIEGDSQGDIRVVYSSSALQEMKLTMTAEATVEEDPLTKNNTIKVDANFTYHGMTEDDSVAYTTMPAMLKVYDKSYKTILTIDKDDTEYYHATESGYHFTLPLNLFPSEQAIRIQVVVEDDMFRDGAKHSNIATFSFEDLHLELVEPVTPTDLEAHVGSEFALDMRKIFFNPDGDPVEYTLTCNSDASASFAFTMEGEQMTIPAGLKPGVYEMSVGAKGEEVVYDQLTLTVVNDPPRLLGDEIPEMEIWSDSYSFQDITSVNNTVNLNSYFADYEQMPISYTVSVSDETLVDWNLSNGVLTVDAVEGMEGDVTVTVTAADGITADSTATTSFEVEVVSGKMVYWRENWIYYAIALVILLIIIITIIVILKNKLVKGTWDITFDDCGDSQTINSIDIAGFVSVGKKSKFKLADLVNELAMFLPDTAWALKLTTYFSDPAANKITLVGVTSKKGCTVTNIPKGNQQVKVNVNGMDITKDKVTMRSGTLTFVIEDVNGDRLTITMVLQ